MRTTLAAMLVVGLVGCGEHRRAARAVDCSGDMQNVSRLTPVAPEGAVPSLDPS